MCTCLYACVHVSSYVHTCIYVEYFSFTWKLNWFPQRSSTFRMVFHVGESIFLCEKYNLNFRIMASDAFRNLPCHSPSPKVTAMKKATILFTGKFWIHCNSTSLILKADRAITLESRLGMLFMNSLRGMPMLWIIVYVTGRSYDVM